MAKKKTDPKVYEDSSALKQEIETLTLSLQRERADAINLRRRHEEQTQKLNSHIKARVITELLPVIDNLERSLSHVPSDLKNHTYIKGIEAIIKQFEKSLNNLGVHKIPTVNEKFDPHLHEAVSFEEGAGNNEIVTEEVQPGYTVSGEVVRPAMVKVKMQ